MSSPNGHQQNIYVIFLRTNYLCVLLDRIAYAHVKMVSKVYGMSSCNVRRPWALTEGISDLQEISNDINVQKSIRKIENCSKVPLGRIKHTSNYDISCC